MLKQRVITALILVPLFLLALFKLPTGLWALLVGVLVLQGAVEWSRLAGLKGVKTVLFLIVMLVSCALLVLMHLVWHAQQKIAIQWWVYGISALFWLVIVPMWFRQAWKPRQPWLLAVVGWIVLIPTGLAMLDLRALSPGWLLGVMAVVWVADTAAYFAGRAFGKHKLAPSISPGKSWEGVAGAVVGVLVYVLLVLAVNDMLQHYRLMLAAAAGVAVSILGDLFESAIKRQAGVKDSGNLLPGHGGLLDRIDALTSTLPLAALLLIVMKAA